MSNEKLSDQNMKRAEFRAMSESSQSDWERIMEAAAPFSADLPNRILSHLRLLDGDHGGFAVDRLTHSLQSATLAHKGGEDEEYVVCALLHDIGDTLGCYNHADIAAAIVKPFVSERNHWMVEKHAIFQGYYFFHHLGLDREMREAHRGHPHFEYTAKFCHIYDQNAFDPSYEAMPLEAFVPMVHRLFARPKRSIYQREDGTNVQKSAAAE